MKIGKIIAFGEVCAGEDWYLKKSLYPTNRIYFVKSGEASFRDGDGEVRFSSGNIYFIPEREDFSPTVSGDLPFVHCYVDFASVCPAKSDKIVSLPIGDDEELRLVLEIFCRAAADKERLKYNEPDSSGSMYALFVGAVEYLVTKFAEVGGAEFISDEAVMRAVCIMNKRMSEKLSVSDIAACVFMSSDGFIRRFSKLMGVTPYAYLKKLRLTAAEGMINDGESLSSVSKAVGYADCAALLHALSSERKKRNR